jgi:hypothetical protein
MVRVYISFFSKLHVAERFNLLLKLLKITNTIEDEETEEEFNANEALAQAIQDSIG